jgi:hypothetical protein
MEWAGKAMISLWRLLVPHSNATAGQLYVARVLTIVMLFSIAIVGGTSLAFAWGLVTVEDFHGFATKDQVATIGENIDALKGLVIGQNIRADSREECNLPSNSNGARDQYEQRIMWELNEYFVATAKIYTRPTCSVFK